MHKTKKKSKTDKIPKPIKVKKEKTEEDRSLHSMAHYVDDRLELIKQVFGTLKPKTITNLAPEFLRNQSLDEIEELCLNELLFISTKRLLSFINGTKCPTDTESSDDSDVERQEEHISLEEISSDSEIDGSDARRVKQKKKKTSNVPNKKDINNSNEKTKEPDGQISVLELLELQARARAIRSQLALEPVTKIEVDTDEETATKKTNASEKSKPSSKAKERKRKSNELDSTLTNSEINSVPSTSAKQTETAAVKGAKKIKIKRNYRNTAEQQSNEQLAEATVTTTVVKPEPNRSRSASPDVIPIQAETETLLISDSSDDETGKTKKKSEKNEPTVMEPTNIEVSKPRKISEIEDGELQEEQLEHSAAEESTDNITKEENRKEQTQPQQPDENRVQSLELKNNESKTDDTETEEAICKTNEENVDATAPQQETAQEIIENNSNSNQSSHEEDDQNDDVISIEGGDDLESEINELEKDVAADNAQAVTASKTSSKQDQEQDEDVISLETSEDEREATKQHDSESWHLRYLKSSKVSQVLAASRLGKRVRDKIKKSKHSKKDSERERKEQDEAEQQKQRQMYATKHEDGSVEQYKELLELRQRKS